MEKLPNHANFELKELQDNAEADIILNDRNIGMIHAQMDNPDAEFDLVIKDMAGNEQLRINGCKNPTKRWGQRVDKELVDSYFKVRIENVKNAKKIDIFVD